jgi:hypothetical protein
MSPKDSLKLLKCSISLWIYEQKLRLLTFMPSVALFYNAGELNVIPTFPYDVCLHCEWMDAVRGKYIKETRQRGMQTETHW